MPTAEPHKASRDCSLCGKPIMSTLCPHRWDLPFDSWSPDHRNHLRAVLPLERHPGS